MKKVLKEVKGEIMIGGTKLTAELSDILQAEALYLESSHILEVLNDTIEEEVFRLSVMESAKWDDILFTKALWHWRFVLNNLIKKLAKKKS